ncbi:MAG: sigma-70 family RNA polymerase sigma factor [Chitinophagales bacterium]
MRLQYQNIHKDIVERCQKGNRQAQQQLYQLYAMAMYNITLRIMGKPEDAEDVLQDAFIDVFTKINSFRGEASIGAWIKRIVINKSLNAVKKKKLMVTDIETVEKDNFVSDYDNGFDEPQAPSFTVSDIQRAIETLPDGYRVVMSLFMFEGYSHQEIAEELNITESTSKSQYSRAKRKVRDILLKQQSRMGNGY